MKKSIVKRILTLALAMGIVCSLASEVIYKTYADANATRFSDVPTSHWAYSDIEALARGGLVNGVGSGKFSPDTKFTISQMAQIICNAQGYDTATTNGEAWYIPAVKHCLEIGCLPDLGEVNGQNYDVTCSRELAVYMLINGLGVPAGKEPQNIEADYIPDYGQVSMNYRDAVLKAYQYKILNGVDSAHTFLPQNGLARSEACAILNRAGYTKAAEKPVVVGEGLSFSQIKQQLHATGLFEESTRRTERGSSTVFTAKDRKYAKLTVQVPDDDNGPMLFISANEIISRISFVNHNLEYNVVYDEAGNVYWDQSKDPDGMVYCYDANGKYMPPSGFSYNSRQLLKQVLNIIYQESGDEAYTAFMNAITPPFTYANYDDRPGTLMWLNGRMFNLSFSDGYGIEVGRLNDKTWYEYYSSKPTVGDKAIYRVNWQYDSNNTDHKMIDLVSAYELNKW